MYPIFTAGKDVYRKPNYSVIEVRFDVNNPARIHTSGDYLDVIKSDQDLSQIFISLNGSDFISLSDAIPVMSPFSMIVLKNNAGNTGYVQLLIGKEWFRSQRQSVALISDKVGLAKELTLQAVRDRLPTSLTASGNLKIALVETTIKQPIDIQDHWTESLALLPSGARTTSGNTADIDVGRFAKAEVCLDVTAVSGTTPTLDVYIEGKDQTSGKYKVIWSQTGINAVGTYWLTITDLIFTYIRVRWVIGGTSPSFTFSVGLEGKS